MARQGCDIWTTCNEGTTKRRSKTRRKTFTKWVGGATFGRITVLYCSSSVGGGMHLEASLPTTSKAEEEDLYLPITGTFSVWLCCDILQPASAFGCVVSFFVFWSKSPVFNMNLSGQLYCPTLMLHTLMSQYLRLLTLHLVGTVSGWLHHQYTTFSLSNFNLGMLFPSNDTSW